jgi:hypothetical protein
MSIEKALPFQALLIDRMNPAKNSGTGLLLRIIILDAFSPFPDETEKGPSRLRAGRNIHCRRQL